MAIQITASMLVGKRDLEALGVATGTDQEITDTVTVWLEDRLRYAFGDIDNLHVGITRKVKEKDFPVIPGTGIAVASVVHKVDPAAGPLSIS